MTIFSFTFFQLSVISQIDLSFKVVELWIFFLIVKNYYSNIKFWYSDIILFLKDFDHH